MQRAKRLQGGYQPLNVVPEEGEEEEEEDEEEEEEEEEEAEILEDREIDKEPKPVDTQEYRVIMGTTCR